MKNRDRQRAGPQEVGGNEPAPARWLHRVIDALRSHAPHVSLIGKLWRIVLLVPVFGMYLIIARWRLWRGQPIEIESAMDAGPRLRCRPPDLVMMYVHLFNVWEPDVSRFVARRLQPGDAFIDIGANVGYYSLLASTRVGDNGRVVAIEASPRIFNRLQGNIDRNDLVHTIRAVNVAAASQAGELSVHLGPEHNLGLTTTSARSGYAAEATVRALPLHEILNDEEMATARLVKIDVEGAEDDVLAGLHEFLKRCRDDVEILVEMTPRWWRSDEQHPAGVLRPLLEAGFHAYQLQNNYWPWRYLWTGQVQPPQRVRFDLNRNLRRLDLVLSRVDTEQL